MIPDDVRAALTNCPRVVLPDRSGYLAFLRELPGIACPGCGRAMGFCLVRQRIDAGGSTWSYSCLSCAPAAA